MKKALLSVALLFLFIGGWGVFSILQVWIPAGSAGVLTTKTGAVHDTVLESGEFFWTWELLLPTNARVLLFPLRERDQEFALEGELPSGKLYGDFLGDPKAFQFALQGRWRGHTGTKNLPLMVAEGRITPESWDKYLEDEAASVLRTIQEWTAAHASAPATPVLIPGETFQELKIWKDISVNFSSVSLPDPQLYELIRNQYLEIQTLLQEKRSDLTIKNRVFELKESEKLGWLEKYGQLLKDHPPLLELWKLSKDVPELKPLLPGVQ